MKRKRIGTVYNHVSKKVGHAIRDYNLIEDNDRIMVSASGGKDSTALLHLLAARRRWAPVRYSLIAAHMIMPMPCARDATPELQAACERLSVPFVAQRVPLRSRRKETGCFWCSWNRRKALFRQARAHGCNKIALGHTKDDIAETILLNLFFLGEISSMNPRQELFGGELTLIRPLCYVDEKTVCSLVREQGITVNSAPEEYTPDSGRALVKQWIAAAETRNPETKTNIIKALQRVRSEYIDCRGDTEVQT